MSLENFEATYFRPQAEVARLEINPGKVRNGYRGPDIRHVVRCPNDTSIHDSHRVNLSCPGPVGEPLVDSPNSQNNHNTQRETNQDLSVETVLSKDLARSNSTPKN